MPIVILSPSPACHPEPFGLVILSEAKDLLPAQGKLREGSVAALRVNSAKDLNVAGYYTEILRFAQNDTMAGFKMTQHGTLTGFRNAFSLMYRFTFATSYANSTLSGLRL